MSPIPTNNFTQASTFALLLVSMCSSLLQAQDSEPSQAEPVESIGEIPTTTSFKAWVQASGTTDTDFDSDIGDFSYSQISTGLSMTTIFERSKVLTFSLEAGITNYDITASSASVAGDAASIGSEFDDVERFSIDAMYIDQFNDQESWFIGGGIKAAGEKDADFGESIDGFFTGGYAKQLNDKLKLGVGILVSSRLDDDVLVVPVPIIEYTINEYWSLATERAGLKLNYRASEQLNYGIMGSYDSDTFRLDDSHAAVREGMANHSRVPVAFFVEYEPNETIVIEAQVGTQFAGELEILDTDGREVTTQDIDTAVFGSLSLSFRF